LPEADVIIFTASGLNRLDEAVAIRALVLVPAEMVPDNQLHEYSRRKEWNGIMQIGTSYTPALCKPKENTEDVQERIQSHQPRSFYAPQSQSVQNTYANQAFAVHGNQVQSHHSHFYETQGYPQQGNPGKLSLVSAVLKK
jgi:hypothetical protein